MAEIIGPTQVTIDFSCLQKNKLSADLYTILFCRHHPNCLMPSLIQALVDDKDDTLHYLEYLEKLGFIKITGKAKFELRQKAIDLFTPKNANKDWLEFLGKFPLKVPSRNNGSRALKVANPDSKGNIRIKKKYLDLIKSSPDLHQTIIKVLEAEVKMRKNSNELQYMHNMETWLNQADYDKYAYLLEESNTDYKNEDYM